MEKEELKKDEKIQPDNKNEIKDNEDINAETNNDKSENTIKEEKLLSPEEEITNLKDKLARTFAEMENQRRRYEKEKDDAFEYGGFAFAKEALNLIDNLERSKISLENDEALKNTNALKRVVDHFDIINKDMLSIFKKNNIYPIKSINQKLDPNLHQAMMEIEDNTKEPGTIVQEIQKGFTMKDRLLRPSLVGVSKQKSDKKPNNNEKDEENQEKNDEN